jgi:hypothetical protein
MTKSGRQLAKWNETKFEDLIFKGQKPGINAGIKNDLYRLNAELRLV